jgi:hypothetical protein
MKVKNRLFGAICKLELAIDGPITMIFVDRDRDREDTRTRMRA